MKKVMKKVLSLLLAAGMVFGAIQPGTAMAEEDPMSVALATDASDLPQADGNTLRLWYTTPGSASTWTNTGLVIGNGHTGGILFGNVGREQIHFNEKTLWNGGPSSSRPNYNGGNRTTAVTKEQLDAIREQADDHSSSVFPLGTGGLGNVMGNGNGMGNYQDFGDLYLDFSATGMTDSNVSNYVRDLDMRTAVSSVNYDYDGVHYEREYFVSHPDGVMVVRLTASEGGKLSFSTSVRAASGLTTTATAQDGKITLAGHVNDNQLKCEMQAQVINEGGSLTNNEDGTVDVSEADAVTIVLATGTDYKNEYPTYRGEDPHDALTAIVDAAADKSYDDLKRAHLDDYQELFGRLELDLGGECPDLPTDKMVQNYRAGDYKLAVEEMVYQFGRYLTIAGSREGDPLPTNLCGIWLIGSAGSFWGADFHFNVNVQMNYWPALATNLAECETVFNDFMESLVEPGRVTAGMSAALPTETGTPIGEGNGFLVNTQNNPFGCTAPFGSQEYGWNIGGSSWALQNVYDYYLYTGDTEYLRTKIYPMLKEMANFWDQFLWYSEYQDRLVVGPSVSAEQGPTVNGTTYDQSIVWELYKMAIDASETLGVDADQRAVWQEKQSQLNPIIIGEEGQVKEWFEESTLGRGQVGDLPETGIPNFGAGGGANQGSVHRHTSQLIGLFPGTLINKDTTEWMDAAIKSLEQRSLNGTGWSKAMKINMYARTGLAEDTYSMVRAMCAGNQNGILDNLLDSHPPFQIDGNYGLTAGMTEMLLQSQLGYTQFLPALPEVWNTGSISGAVSRGNFVIDMEWSDGTADRFVVTSRNGGTFTGEYEGISNAKIVDASGNAVAVEKLGIDKVSFETVQNGVYTITFESAGKLQTKIDEANQAAEQMRGEALAVAKATLDAAIAHAESVLAGQDNEAMQREIQVLDAAVKTAEAAAALHTGIVSAEEAVANMEGSCPEVILGQVRAEVARAKDVLNKADVSIAELNAEANALKVLVDGLKDIDNLKPEITPGQISVGATVTMTSPYQGLDIYFTLDGSEPTTRSFRYTEEFVVPEGASAVTAVLYEGDKKVGTSVSVACSTENIAPTAISVEHSNAYGGGYEGSKAVDGNTGSRWATTDNTEAAWLILTFANPVSVNGASITHYGSHRNRIDKFDIEYWDGENWVAALSDATIDSSSLTSSGSYTFETVTSDKIRLNLKEAYQPSIWEFTLTPAGKANVADRTELSDVLDMADAAKTDGTYGNASAAAKARFDSAYDNAMNANGNINATEAEIQSAAEALRAATDGLSQQSGEVSKNTLKYFLDKAKEHVANGDTEDVDKAVQDLFAEAIQEGDAIMEKADATREEVMNATVKLMLAIHALDMKFPEIVVDKEALKMALEVADQIVPNKDKYVDAGWDEFLAMKAAGEVVMVDADATQEEVDKAWNDLVEAMAKLRYKANKETLKDLLDSLKDLELSGYTEESVKAFRAAVAKAQAVLADDTLSEDTQNIVDEAVKALADAKAALEQKDDTNKSSNAPKTGDSMSVLFMLLAIAVSGSFIAAYFKKRMRV